MKAKRDEGYCKGCAKLYRKRWKKNKNNIRKIMSNAEDRYLEHFQDGRLRNCSSKEAFLLGYHQAEKDLELTYDDICEIMEIREDVLEMDSYENLYEEILKRFKDYKERKEK